MSTPHRTVYSTRPLASTSTQWPPNAKADLLVCGHGRSTQRSRPLVVLHLFTSDVLAKSKDPLDMPPTPHHRLYSTRPLESTSTHLNGHPMPNQIFFRVCGHSSRPMVVLHLFTSNVLAKSKDSLDMPPTQLPLDARVTITIMRVVPPG